MVLAVLPHKHTVGQMGMPAANLIDVMFDAVTPVRRFILDEEAAQCGAAFVLLSL